MLNAPFGSEYSHSARWKLLQRLYIRLFGVVDLPTRLRARCLKKEFEGIPSGQLVDFGAGTGVYSYYLSRDGNREVTAVDTDRGRVADINEVACAIKRTKLKAVCATEEFFGNWCEQPLAGVLAIEVLVYCKDVVSVLKAIHTSLGCGGVLIGHVPVRKRLYSHENHRIDQEGLEKWLWEAGFQDVTIRPSLGRGAERLSAIFEATAQRPILLAPIFPVLLLLMHLTLHHPRSGNSLLFVARK